MSLPYVVFASLLFAVFFFLDISFATFQKSNFCTAVTTQNTTENNCVISHAQRTTAFQTDVLLLQYKRHWSQKRGGRPRSTANSIVTDSIIPPFIFSHFYLNSTLIRHASEAWEPWHRKNFFFSDLTEKWTKLLYLVPRVSFVTILFQ